MNTTDLTAVRDRLLGHWNLVNWRISYSDGRPDAFPFGEDALGVILYTPQSWMSASIARSGRSALSVSSMRGASAEDQASAFASFFHYAGPFYVRASSLAQSTAEVVHRVEMSLNPNFVGSEQVRQIQFFGADGLELSAVEMDTDGGKSRHHRLRWQRALRAGT